MISVVINTLNEEKNLPFALRSVQPWADEIVVVDMYSEDRTVDIARSYGAKVFYHERILAFDQARAFAVAQSTGDWILLLDADELVPHSLSKELVKIASMNSADVVVIPWRNYLLGAPMRCTGWGEHQDRHPRFFKRANISLEARVHGFIHPANDARVLSLSPGRDLSVYHFNYVDTRQFLEKLNRYTTIEARQALERGERSSWMKACLRGLVEFANRFIRKQGFRDGWRGFYLSLFMIFYRIAIYAKLQELETIGSRESIEAHYREEAERVIGAYERMNAS